MFFWRSTVPSAAPGVPAVELGFTGRSAGRGSGPFAGLNLGGKVGDDSAQVESNRRLVCEALAVPRERLLFANQVRGTDVVTASGPWAAQPPTADAIIATAPGLAVAVLVADCVPVLLHDASAGLVAAVHAGREGMTNGVVPATLDRMGSLGATSVRAVVGPAVCGRCYEVPADLAATSAGAAPSSLTRSWTGTPALDVAAGVVEQLAERQVPLDWVPGCTRESDDLYSYRRSRITGRSAGVVMLRATSPA